MVGEENLTKLLASMSPELLDVEYVFCTFERACYGDYSELEPVASIQESEGLTLIIPRLIADEKKLLLRIDVQKNYINNPLEP